MAATDDNDAGFRIVLISRADGRTEDVPVGSYPASYNPEGAGGNGIVAWTPDRAQAMTFATCPSNSPPHCSPRILILCL